MEQITVLSKYELVDVRLIELPPSYQRCIEPRRLKKISNSIKLYGYWPQEVITVNKGLQIIDGQHRYHAAIDNGIKKIPISILRFENISDEAKFFCAKNSYNTSLKPIDFWHAAFLAGDITANVIYQLNTDDDSLLKDMISLKGSEGKTSKFNVTECIAIIKVCALGMATHGGLSKNEFLSPRIGATSYYTIKEEVNLCVGWFFDCFGDKKNNPIPFRGTSISAILPVYIELKKQGFLNTAEKRKSVVRKFRAFHFDGLFIKAGLLGQTMSLVNHFNHKRKKRLNYEP